MGAPRGAKRRRVSTPPTTEVPMAKSSAAAKSAATPRIHVYISPSERSAIAQRATAEGIGTSAYVRRLVKRDLARPASSA